VQRLERDGVITGYHARIDPKKLGYPLAAIVRIAPASRQLDKIRQVARETPEVVECHRSTGEDCFFLKLHLRPMDDLEPCSIASRRTGPRRWSIRARPATAHCR
jgi:Lrp/AsnC family leucine-responsive transcriptional regulator